MSASDTVHKAAARCVASPRGPRGGRLQGQGGALPHPRWLLDLVSWNHRRLPGETCPILTRGRRVRVCFVKQRSFSSL